MARQPPERLIEVALLAGSRQTCCNPRGRRMAFEPERERAGVAYLERDPGIALGDTLFFAALKELTPHTFVMLMTSGQVLTVLLAVVFLQEPLPRLARISLLCKAIAVHGHHLGDTVFSRRFLPKRRGRLQLGSPFAGTP